MAAWKLCRLDGAWLALVVIAVCGCQTTWLSGRSAEKPQASQADQAAKKSEPTAGNGALPIKAFADERWAQTLPPGPGQDAIHSYRWTHPSIEAWFAVGGDHSAVLTQALSDAQPVVAANAAILLGRAGHPEAIERLAATVANTQLTLPLRNAAAEALARIPTPEAHQALTRLTVEFGNFDPAAQAAYVAGLHAELLLSLARAGSNEDNTMFRAALTSPIPAVRKAAVQAWLQPERQPLPLEALDLITDPDPQVRVAALGAIASQRPERACEMFEKSFHDIDLDVRMAAIAGFGQLATPEAQTALEGLRTHPAEVVRVAVVESLGRSQGVAGVIDSGKDKSWQVRAAVARGLRPSTAGTALGPTAVSLACALVHDPSMEVQRHMIESLASWPKEQAGAPLLIALAQGGFQTRRDATRQLGQWWKPASDFPYDGPTAARQAAIAALRKSWQSAYGSAEPVVEQASAPPIEQAKLTAQQLKAIGGWLAQLRDPDITPTTRTRAVEALVACGPGLIVALQDYSGSEKPALPQSVYDEVLPRISPVMAAIAGLNSTDPPQRRIAAAQMASAAAGRNIPELALDRLVEHCRSETDAVVWQSVLSLTAADDRPQAVDLAYLAIGNNSTEVRRRACDYMAAHASCRHVPVLIPALTDRQMPVVVAAVRAIGNAGSMEDPQPLVQLLLSSDKNLRVEVATSLCRLRQPAGAPALERLALDNDDDIRRRAATAMGELKDPAFVPLLLDMLQGSADVQHAALTALTTVTGHDFSRTAEGQPQSREEQARLWRNWYRDQQTAEG